MDSCDDSSDGRDQAGVREEVEFQAGVVPFCQLAEVFDCPTAVGTFQAGVIPVAVDHAGVRDVPPGWLGVAAVEVDGFQAGVRADEAAAFQAGVLELAAGFHPGVRDDPEFQPGVLAPDAPEFQAGVLPPPVVEFQAGVRAEVDAFQAGVRAVESEEPGR